MRATRLLTNTALLGLALASTLAAQQAAAPKDATGQCTDGSYTTAKTEAKGCLKHGGVKTWYAGASAAAPAPASVAASAPAATASPNVSTSASGSTKSAPKDATGQCTDGSYTTAKTQARGCLKHGGVKTWYGPGAAAPAASEATASPTSAPAPAAAPAAAPARTTASNASTAAPAPANPTDVWVNLSTKAYHCPGTKYYGTTKHGKYMSEADARAAGFHASYGKACS